MGHATNVDSLFRITASLTSEQVVACVR